MNIYRIYFMEWDDLGQGIHRNMTLTANDIDDVIAKFNSLWIDADVVILTIKYIA